MFDLSLLEKPLTMRGYTIKPCFMQCHSAADKARYLVKAGLINKVIIVNRSIEP
jgi:hypothetical protein